MSCRSGAYTRTAPTSPRRAGRQEQREPGRVVPRTPLVWPTTAFGPAPSAGLAGSRGPDQVRRQPEARPRWYRQQLGSTSVLEERVRTLFDLSCIVLLLALGAGGCETGARAEPGWPVAKCSSRPAAAEYVMLGTAGSSRPACQGVDGSPWAGAHGPGAPCNRSVDCQPVCCACGNAAGRNALTSLCLDGKCADPEQACCALLGTKTISCGHRKQ